MKQQQRLRARQPLSHKPETWLFPPLALPKLSRPQTSEQPNSPPKFQGCCCSFQVVLWVLCVCLSGDRASAVHHVMWGIPRTSSGFFLVSTEIILVGRPQCFTRNAFHQMDVSLGCFNFTESSSEDDHARKKKKPEVLPTGEAVSSTQEQRCVWLSGSFSNKSTSVSLLWLIRKQSSKWWLQMKRT